MAQSQEVGISLIKIRRIFIENHTKLVYGGRKSMGDTRIWPGPAVEILF